jgi:hypothetical protein
MAFRIHIPPQSLRCTTWLVSRIVQLMLQVFVQVRVELGYGSSVPLVLVLVDERNQFIHDRRWLLVLLLVELLKILDGCEFARRLEEMIVREPQTVPRPCERVRTGCTVHARIWQSNGVSKHSNTAGVLSNPKDFRGLP